MMASHKRTPSLVLPSHPLARGLVGCWLFNEGSGSVVLDRSGYAHHGTATGASWTQGDGGRALEFDGGATPTKYLSLPDSALLRSLTSGFSVFIRFCPAVTIDSSITETIALVDYGDTGASGNWLIFWPSEDNGALRLPGTYGGFKATTRTTWTAGQWYHVGFVYSASSDVTSYINGKVETTTGTPDSIDGNSHSFTVGSRYIAGAPVEGFNGQVDSILIFDRVLAASEIAWLYREPFAFLQTPGLWGPVSAAGVTHELSGSVTAASSLSATARVVRSVSGLVNCVTSLASSLHVNRSISAAINAASSMSGALSFLSAGPDPVSGEAKAWRSAILLNGVTSAAFKLGTVLTGGWFWTRRAGCSAVYRGPSLAEVDFNDILCVAGRDVQQVSLPAYLSHEPNTSYCYVVRRFNGCGDVEQTTAAAVVVRIGPDGQLAQSVANAVFGLHASQIAGHKVRLLWFYCSLDQQVAPEAFNVYWDSGDGQMDFTEPLAEVSYRGPKCYTYVSDSLADGTYRFAVRAGGENQAESMSLSSVSCSIQTCVPQAMTILAVEAIP